MHILPLRSLIVLIIAAILLLMFTAAVRSRPYLQIDALAIGQGDSMLITTPHLRTILIDGGPSSDILTELPKALGGLRDTIDLLIISHPDGDHINGLVDILPRYHIKGILMTDTDSTSLAFRELKKLIAYHKIPIISPHPGLRIHIDPDVSIDLLYPWQEALPAEHNDTNNSSIVAKLQYGDTSILLTGDIELPAEEVLLRSRSSLKSTLLKVGHHGSKTSTSPTFFQAVRPRYALIQFGHNNSYGHPHTEVLETLGDIPIFESSRKSIRILCTPNEFCTSTEELNSLSNQRIVESLLSPPHGAFHRYSHILGVL